jgi:acyl-CoA oxidase
MNGRLSMQRGRTVGDYINRLLVKIRPHAVDLVDAFGYGPDHIRAAISTGAEKARQDQARDYLRAQRASGQPPWTKKYSWRPHRGHKTHRARGCAGSVA